MVKFKNYLVAVILGIALAFSSVVMVGYTAALSVPAEILKTLTRISEWLAFLVVDFFIIAIPMAAAFLLLAYVCKFVFKKADNIFYFLLLTPQVLMDVSFLLQSPPQINVILSMFSRYLLLAICFYFLVRSNKSATATAWPGPQTRC